MYNAMPLEGVAYLVEFMKHFKNKYPEQRSFPRL